jgi:hypothetical protein
MVKPATVLAWHRKGFKLFWRWKSRKRGPGRRRIPAEIRELIVEMAEIGVRWGAPRIHGELVKLGIDLSEITVSRYMPKCPPPRGSRQRWSGVAEARRTADESSGRGRYRARMDETMQTLDLGAFKHVVVPIGVIIGLGVARTVMSVSHYIQHRERVRFSAIHAVWSAFLFLLFVGVWWILWGLRYVDAERWSYFTLIYLLAGPALLYLPSILLLPEVPDAGELDLGSLFDRASRPFFLCLAGFTLWLASVEIYLLREPLLVPPRANQGVALGMFLIAAVFPSRRMAGGVGAAVLLLAVVALTTWRAKLA